MEAEAAAEEVGPPEEGEGEYVVLFYCFRELHAEGALAAEVARQQQGCEQRGLLGRLLLAPEGINGTLAADNWEAMANYVRFMCSDPLWRMKSQVTHSSCRY